MNKEFSITVTPDTITVSNCNLSKAATENSGFQWNSYNPNTHKVKLINVKIPNNYDMLCVRWFLDSGFHVECKNCEITDSMYTSLLSNCYTTGSKVPKGKFILDRMVHIIDLYEGREISPSYEELLSVHDVISK